METERPWVESLVACIPHPVALLGADWSIIWANRELSEVIGLAHGLKGFPLSQLVQDWDGHAEHIRTSYLPGARAALDVCLYRADGTTLTARLHVARCHPAAGAAWAMHLEDTSEKESLLRRLGERERSHSFLQANTSDLLVRVDAALDVVWCNEAAAISFPMGDSLLEILDSESGTLVGEESPHAGEARFEVVLRSAQAPVRQFRGVARRLTDDVGADAGLSLLLRDDTENVRMANFVTEYALSAREAEILEYMAQGFTNLNIASLLGLSESGVKFHIRNIFARAKVSNRTELIALMLRD